MEPLGMPPRSRLVLCLIVSMILFQSAGAAEWMAPLVSEEIEDTPYHHIAHIVPFGVYTGLDPVHRRMIAEIDAAGMELPLAACFSPGSSEKAVNAFEDLLAPHAKYQTNSRWTETATDGANLPSGIPITLTYSFAPDGTFIPGFLGEASAPSNLFEFLNGIHGSEQEWMPLFHSVFARWGEVTGVTYVYEPNDDGASFSNLSTGAKGIRGVRGDVRIGGHRVDGPGSVLAYNFYPTNSEMILDTSDIVAFSDASSNWVRTRNIISHEHGHGMGFQHSCPVDKTKLMEPFLILTADGPQHDEIRGSIRQYGDRFIGNDHPATAAGLGIVDGRLLVADVGLQGKSDVDYYRFSTTYPSELRMEVEAVGRVYTAGLYSSGNCSSQITTDSSSSAPLGIDFMSADGIWKISSASSAEGMGIVLPMQYLPAGEWMVRIRSNGTDAVQLYNLHIEATETNSGPQTDLAVSIEPYVGQATPGAEMRHLITVRNAGEENVRGARMMLEIPPALVDARLEAIDGVAAVVLTDGSDQAGAVFDIEPDSVGHFLLRTRIDADSAELASVHVTVMPAMGVMETDVMDNHAIADPVRVLAPAKPKYGELFTSFQGLSGSSGKLGDGAFPGGYRLTAFTTSSQGFVPLEGIAPFGRALSYLGSERGAMATNLEFTDADFSEETHQLAFSFRFNQPTANGMFTQLVTARNRFGDDMAYVVRVGQDEKGIVGVSILHPGRKPGEIVATPTVPVEPAMWHRCVVQYASPFNRRPDSQGGSLKAWVLPLRENSKPDIHVTEDGLSAQFGAGPIGRLSFGAAHFRGITGAPAVYIASVGLWNGAAIDGINDIEAGLAWLDGEFQPLDPELERAAVIAQLLGFEEKAHDVNDNGIIDAADLILP